MNQNQEEVPDACAICEQSKARHTQIVGAGLVCRVSAVTYRPKIDTEAIRIAAHNEGKREAYEDAAKVAEHYNFGPERTERDNARNATAEIIARAIRAKLAPEHQQGEDR